MGLALSRITVQAINQSTKPGTSVRLSRNYSDESNDWTKPQSGNPLESTVITCLDTSYSNWNELTFNDSFGGRQLFFRLFSRHLLTVQSRFISQQMSKDILRVRWCQSEEVELAKRPVTPKGPRTVQIQTSGQV